MPFMTEGTSTTDSVEWGTPDNLFRPLHDLYRFTLDGAAAHGNHKLPRYCTAEGTFRHPVSAGDEPVSYERRIGDDFGAPVRHAVRYEDPPHQINELDGLQLPWTNERVFLNPPWGASEDPCGDNCVKQRCGVRGWHAERYMPGIADFIRKARDEALRHRALVVVVFPARIDNDWFHDYVLPYARIQWRRQRPKFIDPEAEARAAADLPARTSAPVGIGIAVFR